MDDTLKCVLSESVIESLEYKVHLNALKAKLEAEERAMEEFYSWKKPMWE